MFDPPELTVAEPSPNPGKPLKRVTPIDTSRHDAVSEARGGRRVSRDALSASPTRRRSASRTKTKKERERLEMEEAVMRAAQQEARVCEKELIVSMPDFGFTLQVIEGQSAGVGTCIISYCVWRVVCGVWCVVCGV